MNDLKKLIADSANRMQEERASGEAKKRQERERRAAEEKQARARRNPKNKLNELIEGIEISPSLLSTVNSSGNPIQDEHTYVPVIVPSIDGMMNAALWGWNAMDENAVYELRSIFAVERIALYETDKFVSSEGFVDILVGAMSLRKMLGRALRYERHTPMLLVKDEVVRIKAWSQIKDEDQVLFYPSKEEAEKGVCAFLKHEFNIR